MWKTQLRHVRFTGWEKPLINSFKVLFFPFSSCDSRSSKPVRNAAKLVNFYWIQWILTIKHNRMSLLLFSKENYIHQERPIVFCYTRSFKKSESSINDIHAIILQHCVSEFLHFINGSHGTHLQNSNYKSSLADKFCMDSPCNEIQDEE